MDINFVEKIFDSMPKFSLKTPDAVIVSTAILYQSILISWDKKLLSEAKTQRIPGFTPTEYIASEEIE